ncbi:hypothetical protein BH10PAT2_BH10PAT2_3180 [soil metagenome]
MRNRSSTMDAIVLKRTNVGESDRIVTLLTPDQGKLACVAKGVRKLTSSQRAYLEPGNLVSIYVLETTSLPILTQTKLINDFSQAKKDLQRLKQLTQVLEIVDRLFPEGVEEVELFQTFITILEQLDQPKVHFLQIQEELSQVLVQLGYQHLSDTPYKSVIEYVASVADRPLRSFDYMTVKSRS